jgi:hypothetical protein
VSDIIHSCRPADISRAIADLNAAGHPAHATLFRAVLAGELLLGLISDRRKTVRPADLWPITQPVLLVIGDDDEKPTGPTGWRCAETVTTWAKAAIVHGTGAAPSHYAEAVRAATITGRAVLVETNSAKVTIWARRFSGKPVLTIIPPPGCVHPLSSREVVQ